MLIFKNVKAIIALLPLLVLSGCGGGGGGDYGGGGGGNSGGGGGNYSAVVLGKVVDMNGNVVPGVTVDNGGTHVTTLSQGAFRLDNVSGGVHRLYASTQTNGTNYSGSTQVLVLNNTTVSNANIQLSPVNQQATIQGTVRDQNGQPLSDTRIFLGVYVTPPSSVSSGDVASLVAFADRNGHYQLQNVPTGVTRYTLAASVLNYQNALVSVDNLQPGETRAQDFQLAQSFNQSVLAPSNPFLQSFTQPSHTLSAYTANAQSKAGGVYEQIRRALSPNYAKLADAKHLAAHTNHLQAHDYNAFGNAVVEMDLFFAESQTPSLSGYRIYNSANSGTVTPYDFLQDPLANVYTDIAPSYVPNQTYYFAVSAVNTDGTESPLSQTVSAVPLDLLTLNQPQPGQQLSNPLTVTWNLVNGATAYQVFVYSAYPGINTSPIAQSPSLAGGSNAYTFPGTLAQNQDYWVVVAASSNGGNELSVSPIVHFHI